MSISTCALREEGDVDHMADETEASKISIHALREEGDSDSQQFQQCRVISIHALREEGDETCAVAFLPLYNFYPRPPRGGRPSGYRCVKHNADPFLSTPSAKRATFRSPLS